MSSRPTSTCVGVATGSPDGGVAIVRISGPAARELGECVLGSLGPPRRAVLRRLRVQSGDESALALFMPGPGSFTGEDVLELHVHGGSANVREVVNHVLEVGRKLGAIAAGPGDFSRRAFMHGRLGLDQLEGIAAVIAARTEAALAQARRLVAGELGDGVDAVRETIGIVRLEVEANLDFPEDVGSSDVRRLEATLRGAQERLSGWLSGFETGRRSREGIRVVFAGPPNAGKSALVNALAGRERVLVSEIAGTTRDYVEVEVEWGGRSVVLIDTAGMRALDVNVPEARVEAAGIALGRGQMAGAELVVWCESPDACDSTERVKVEQERNEGVLQIFTKADLDAPVDEAMGGWPKVSARTGEGLAALRGGIEASFQGVDEPWIGLARHRDRADEAADALARAIEHLAEDRGLEVVALELGVCVSRLSEITGRARTGAVGADVLDGIFGRFCIGK